MIGSMVLIIQICTQLFEQCNSKREQKRLVQFWKFANDHILIRWDEGGKALQQTILHSAYFAGFSPILPHPGLHQDQIPLQLKLLWNGHHVENLTNRTFLFQLSLISHEHMVMAIKTGRLKTSGCIKTWLKYNKIIKTQNVWNFS